MSSERSSSAVEERLPRNYRTVLEAVREVSTGAHLSAQEVFVRARAAQPKIGFATVHRALGRLNELGYVFKLDVPGATCAVYEPALSPHAHFRCTGCGSIQDVEFSMPQALLAELSLQHGLQIAAEATTFAGLCATCARA